MAKSKPKILDKNSAMERILGVSKPEEPARSEAEAPAVNAPESAPKIETVKPEPQPPEEETAKKGRAAKKQPYVQTAFYITKKQHKALKIRAARGDSPNEKDMSAIVRTALDMYLGL